MDIIVRGEPHEIDFVRRICRDKVRRGMLAILPATGPDSDDVVKLRNERDETTKENERLKLRVAELENQIASVPGNAESVPEISESAPEESNLENPDAMDSKYVDMEDLQEVDLDADDKVLPGDDSKDVQANDAKEAPAAKKEIQTF